MIYSTSCWISGCQRQTRTCGRPGMAGRIKNERSHMKAGAISIRRAWANVGSGGGKGTSVQASQLGCLYGEWLDLDLPTGSGSQ